MKKVFILGCDRSGTTAFARRLASKTNTIFLPEMQFIGDLLMHSTSESFGDVSPHLFNQFNAYKFDKKEISKRNIKETDDVFKNFYDLIGIELDDSLDYYLDHTPWSDLSIPTDFIDEQTYFIHVLRDGEDVSKSLKLQYWGPNTTYTSQKYWGQRIFEIENFLKGKKGMTILHKDLIESPEKILKKVIAFLNVNEIENSESTKYFKLHKKDQKHHANIFRDDFSKKSSNNKFVKTSDIRFYFYYKKYFSKKIYFKKMNTLIRSLIIISDKFLEKIKKLFL